MMALIPELDLLTRLRQTKRNGKLHREAAAEIERLRDVIEEWEHSVPVSEIRTATIEECAQYLEDKADLMTNSLHCGDNSAMITTTHRTAIDSCEAARRIRALKEADHAS